MNLAEKLQTVAENQQKVYDAGHTRGQEAGKEIAYDEFWDVYQYGGKSGIYMYAFGGSNWKDDIYNPKYPIRVISNGNNMFYGSSITDTKVPIDISKLTGNGQNMFQSSLIVTIPKLIVSKDTTALTTAFSSCSKLQNITIEGEIAKNIKLASSPLTKASIVSVINALSDEVSDTTATFKATAVNTAFETSEGAADGSTSEDWLNLIATKSNWTISLV